MNFRIIEKEGWKRAEYFQHYFSSVPCTYSMTTKLDITDICKSKMRLYPTMLYCITTIVNRHEEFRTSLNSNNELGIFEQMLPCYTIFDEQTEMFSNIWTEYTEDYKTFCKSYEQDIEQYGKAKTMEAKPNVPENTFPVSMIPWTSFDGFNLNLQDGYKYLLPIFTMGRFSLEGDKTLLPISVQVHHAVCDGFHLWRFLNELQELLYTLPTSQKR